MKRLLLITLQLLLCLLVSAQTKKITGEVVDEKKQPIVGASVTLKGAASNGTSTDANGRFQLQIPSAGERSIIVKYLGYKTQEVNVGNQTIVNVRLLEDASTLSEVVVNVGYGTVSRERLAGSISSIKSKDVADFPVSTLAEALAGKLAGVSVTQNEGAPGADVQILVRGGTSVTQDNAPLYIVDGVPLERALSIISPSEIVSVDVLKDLASTSIYGARGANGVVIITTKTGRPGKPVVSFDTYAGIRKITNYMQMMNPYDYVKTQYDVNMVHWGGALITDTVTINGFKRRYGNYEDFEIYKSFPVVNWQDRVFGRDAFSNTQNLNLSGGSQGSTYNFSVNRTDEDGIMLASNLTRTFASFRYDNELSKTFKVGINARYSDQLVSGNGTSVSGSNGGLQNSARFQPYEGASNASQRSDDALFEDAIDLTTPVGAATRDQRLNKNVDLITSGYINVNISPKFTFRSNVGYRTGTNNNDSFRGVVQYESSSFSKYGNYKDQPYIELSNSKTVGINNSNTLNYRTTFKKDHRLEVLLGQEINQLNVNSYGQRINYFPSNVNWKQAFGNIQQANAPQGFIQPSPTNNVQSERLLSFFGRAMYSFKSKYNLNLSVRRDGTSKFGPENRWGVFPSAQAAWRLSDEEFFKDLKLNWLNGVKFRASYGTAGNNRVNSDRLYATIFATSASLGGYAETDNSQTAGLYPTALENRNLKWETTVSKNIGLDLDLFNSKLTAAIDIYSNTTNDLLLNTNIPQQTGYTQQTQNIGSTRNRGLEVQLNYQAVNTKNFTYNTSFNISFNRNVVLKLNQAGASDYGYAVSSGWGVQGTDFRVQVGQPVGLYYGFISDGFYTLDDFDRAFYESELLAGRRTWRLKPGVASNAAVMSQGVFPGVMKLKDINGDGIINDADKQVLGSYQPKFFGGWNNQFTYKGFDMSVFVNFSYGNKTYNANKINFSSNYQVNGNNFLEKFENRYTYFDANGAAILNWDALNAANANATTYMPTMGYKLPVSEAIEDASFLRITNVTLGYTLPTKWLQGTKIISRLRVYATVNNLYTFTNYSGYDPQANTRFSPLTPGVDYNAYPRSRYMLAGLNVTF